MKIDGDTIFFKSTPDFFYREEEGKKPNTTQVISEKEWYELVEMDAKEEIRYIKVEHPQVPESNFTRELTDVCIVGDILGFYLVVFSWKHKVEVLK